MSMQELAYLTRARATRHGRARGLSFSYISLLERGERRATPAVIELLACALGLQPKDFVEFRLASARELFDEQAVGRSRALEHLHLLQQAVSCLMDNGRTAAKPAVAEIAAALGMNPGADTR